MPFDWFTIVAQCINFIILLWLLKRFLYRPILDGLDAREQRLKNVLEQANIKKAKAEQLMNEFHRNQQELQQQCDSVLKKAHQQATEERQCLFDSAQKAADEMLRKRLEALQQELQNLQQEILKKNITEVYATSTKILTDLAGIDLHNAMLEKFITRLEALPDEQKASLLNALENANNIVLLRSAFEFSEQDKNKIIQTLQTLFAKQDLSAPDLRFKLIPELVAGIEMSVSGWKLAWSIRHYMQSIQNCVHDNIKLAPFQNNMKSQQFIDYSVDINET